MKKEAELLELAGADRRIAAVREHVERQCRLLEEWPSMPQEQRQLAEKVLQTARAQLAVMEEHRTEILRTLDDMEDGRIPPE